VAFVDERERKQGLGFAGWLECKLLAELIARHGGVMWKQQIPVVEVQAGTRWILGKEVSEEAIRLLIVAGEEDISCAAGRLIERAVRKGNVSWE